MNKRNVVILYLSLIGAFLTVLDTGILYTGTVKLASALSLSTAQLSWVQEVYVLTYAGFMLLGGKLGDIYGRKKLFIFSLLLFGAGSLAVGLSVNAEMIITFRAIQGIGAAILQPTCLAIITDTFKGEELQKAIGYYAAVIGAGAVIGVVFGGACAEFISWRLGFIINAPLAMVMSIIAVSVLNNQKNVLVSIDWIGNILSVLAMTTLSYGIAGQFYPYLILIISMGIWILFIVSQGKVKAPMMPLIIFQDKERIGSYLGSLLFSAAGVIFWFYIPQFLQNKIHLTAFVAALGMIPMSLLLFIVAVKANKVIAKFGSHHVLIIGLLLVLISGVGLGILSHTHEYLVVLPFTLSFGIGFALSLTPLTSSAMKGITKEMRGAASGVYNTTRQFGAALGLAIGLSFTGHITSISVMFERVMFLASALTLLGILSVAIFVFHPKQRED